VTPEELREQQEHRDRVKASDRLDRAATRAVNSLRAERDAQLFGTVPEPFEDDAA
jgi:hypothetical protein